MVEFLTRSRDGMGGEILAGAGAPHRDTYIGNDVLMPRVAVLGLFPSFLRVCAFERREIEI